MDEEVKKLLEENIAISRESLKILKGIRRSNRLALAFKAFYWLIVLGVLAGSFYYLQPYIKQTIAIVQQARDAVSGIQKVGDTINGTQKNLQQGISPDAVKNLPPDLLKNLQNIFKTQ